MEIEAQDSRYPRWVYSKEKPKGLLIHNEQEFMALKGEWFSHSSLQLQWRVVGEDAPKAEEPKPSPKFKKSGPSVVVHEPREGVSL